MLFVSSPSPDGKSSLIDLDTGSVHRTYTSDPSVGCHAPSYGALTEALYLPQDKACLYQFSPLMQQPVQKSFTTERLSSTCPSPCGTILVGGSSETGCLYIWNVITGEMLRLVKAHLRQVTCVAFSSDGSLFATASEDSTCKVWPLASLVSSTTANPVSDVTFTAHTLGVTVCQFLHFACVVASASKDRTIKLFHARTAVQLMSVTVDVPLTTLCVSPDDRTLVIGGQQGHLFFISLHDKSNETALVGYPISRDASWTPELRRRPPVEGGHAKNIVCIAFPLPPRQQEVIVVSENGTILVWDCDSLRVVQQVATIKKGVCNVAFIPHLTSSSIPRLTYSKCISLSKYPVDPVSQVGYSVPVPAAPGDVTTKSSNQFIHENAKYNKGKQKRQREERAREVAASEAKAKEEAEKLKLNNAKLAEVSAKTQSLEEMASKLREKIARLEGKRGSA